MKPEIAFTFPRKSQIARKYQPTGEKDFGSSEKKHLNVLHRSDVAIRIQIIKTEPIAPKHEVGKYAGDS